MKIKQELKQTSENTFMPINVVKLEALDLTFLGLMLLTLIGGLIN